MALLSGLPVEIIQQIATHLPACADLLNFSLCARKVHGAVFATQAVYRELFLRCYDKPPEWEKYNYRRGYWRRQHVLGSYLDSTELIPAGDSNLLTEQLLREVKDLMFEAHTKNFAHLHRFALSTVSNPLEYDDSTPCTKLLRTLQLLLTNLAASSRLTWISDSAEIVHSQRWAYGNGTRSLFEKGGIDGPDLTRLWHTANFFLLHFKGLMGASGGGLKLSGLKLDFESVLNEERGAPEMFKRLDDETVPRYWFGFYVYLEPEDIHQLRTTPVDAPLQDHYDGRLSIMELDITDTTFTGTGSDIEPFTVKGAISALPPICSIPGWRRISFSNNYPEDRWLYEGCLLPGSTTILGRWTTFDEDEIDDPGTSGWEGPFVMWAVSKRDFEYEKALREAVVSEDDFLNH